MHIKGAVPRAGEGGAGAAQTVAGSNKMNTLK